MSSLNARKLQRPNMFRATSNRKALLLLSCVALLGLPPGGQLASGQGDRKVDIATSNPATYEIDNHSLADFLAWAASQTKRKLVFASPEARVRAAHTIIRGSINGMDATAALPAVMATTDLGYSVTATRIVIGVK